MALRSATLLALSLVALPALAQSSFYGGDPDLIDALGSEVNTLIDLTLTYDDFTLGTGGAVTQMYGNFATDAVVKGLYYEIRSGVSEGDGGTLLFSGTLANPTVAATGESVFGLDVYRVSGAPTGVFLDPGTYWMTVAVVDGGLGRAYLTTTSGQNGIGGPLGDGNSYFSSPPLYDFVSTLPFVSSFDFSMGLDTQPVPEPATIAALGLGSLAFLRRRKG